MPTHLIRSLLAALVMILALTACSTTKKVAEWRDETYTGDRFDVEPDVPKGLIQETIKAFMKALADQGLI